MSDAAIPPSKPDDEQIFIGYVPDLREFGWKLEFRQDLVLGERIVRRVTWSQPESAHVILVIETAEFPSYKQAVSRLELEVRESQVEFVPGPPHHGSPSLIRKDRPSSAYFCHANLMIRLVSSGREPIDVSPWAEKIAAELSATRRAGVNEHLVVKPIAGPRQGAGPIPVGFSLPWDRGEWSFLHVKAERAAIARAPAGNHVLVFREEGQTPALYAWVIEPGRKVYSGGLRIQQP